MLAKRIIPCLDVQGGKVVKGIQFKNHREVGDILALAEFYCELGADELVFYDINASCSETGMDRQWVRKIAKFLNIPFCVAGGIRTIRDAEIILNSGADKISINSPALERPELINELADAFGKQCVVVGIDSFKDASGYKVFQYTGNSKKIKKTERLTADWIQEVESRGAGEIVLNCMNQDGMRNGYDIAQLKRMRKKTILPLIASGGAGKMQDFFEVFNASHVDGALAASVFHTGFIKINELKQFLLRQNIGVRNEI